MAIPHLEERPLGRVSRDEASWFETAQERLLTMRGKIALAIAERGRLAQDRQGKLIELFL